MAPDTPEREPEMQDTPPCQSMSAYRTFGPFILEAAYI